jgi:hypothetical protein
MLSQLLLKDVWQYLSADALKGQRAVEYPLEWGADWGRNLKEVPRRTDENETSGVRIRIIQGFRDWNDGHGCRDALGDNASHNTLTMSYFIVWEKKEISFSGLDL